MQISKRAGLGLALACLMGSMMAKPAAAADRALCDAAEGGADRRGEEITAGTHTAYVDALRNPRHAWTICEEYRAAAGIDVEHDRADRDPGHRIACPVLALWSAHGPLDDWYPEGPLALWRQWADNVSGQAVEGGHFFPEAAPRRTVELLRDFLKGSA